MVDFFRKLFGKPVPPRHPLDTSPKGIYSELRAKALGSKATDFGLPQDTDPKAVFAVVMDMRYADGMATLFVGADGTASMYTSTGGGVIGGHAHEAVRKAAADLLAVANACVASMSAAGDEPPPQENHTTFFAKSGNGLHSGSAESALLGSGKHALSHLFLAGHAVITQLRQVAPQ